MNISARLYRMETSQHICPFGLRARDLLKRQGYKVDDQILSSRDEVEKIKSELSVKTTPQIIIEGERIGGFDDLKSHLGTKTLKPLTFQSLLCLALRAY